MEEQKVKVKTLKITSPEFKDSQRIPQKYTCDGINVNPPLLIENLPEDVKSLAIIVDDPDAPKGTWVHWLVWNIIPGREIKQNIIPGTEGINDFNSHHYEGPCPPSGTHRYFFKVYALDTILDLDKNTRKKDLVNAMKNHIEAEGELVGLYSR